MIKIEFGRTDIEREVCETFADDDWLSAVQLLLAIGMYENLVVLGITCTQDFWRLLSGYDKGVHAIVRGMIP